MTGISRTLLILFLLSGPGAGGLAAPEEKNTGKAVECLHKAFDAVRAVKDHAIRSGLFEGIGQDLACAGDLAGARQAAAEIDDAKAAADILAEIGWAQAKRGEGDAAKATLAEALRRFGEASRDGRLLLFHAHLAAGQLADAAEVASRFESQFDRSTAQIDIAEAHLAAGRREEARAMLRRVPTTSTKTSESHDMWWIPEKLWPLYVQMGDVDEALKLADAMPKGECARCWVFRDVAQHYAKAGDKAAPAMFAKAFQAAEEIEEGSIRECQMANVVLCRVEAGDIDGAIKTLQLIPDCYHKAYAFEAVAAAQAKAGKQAAARATLEQAISMVECALAEQQDLKAQSLAELAECQFEIEEKAAAANTIAKALQALNQVDNEYNVQIPAAVIAAAQVRLGDLSAAKQTLEEAARKVSTISDAADRAHEAGRIAAAQIALGFNEAALTTVREIVLPLVPLPNPALDGREEAAMILARAGDLARGYQLAREIREDPYARANGVRKVAAYHVMAKGPDEVLALAVKETDPVLRSSLYHGIALTLLKSGGIVAPTFVEQVDPDAYSNLWTPATH